MTLTDSLTTGAWLQRCGSSYVSNHNRLQILIAVYLEFTTLSQLTKAPLRKVCDDHVDVPVKIFFFVLFQATTIAPSPLSGGFVERVQSFRPLCEFFSIFAKYLHNHSPWISHHISHIRSCSAEINLMYALYAGFDDVDEKLLRQLPIDMSHKMSLFFK